MFNTLAAAATVGVLCWPVVSFASPDYTDRALRTDPVASMPAKSLLGAVPAKSKSTYHGYYGPTDGSTNRPTPLFLGLGGKW